MLQIEFRWQLRDIDLRRNGHLMMASSQLCLLLLLNPKHIKIADLTYINTVKPRQNGGIIFCNEKFEFLLQFHWSLFLRVQGTIFQHSSIYVMAPSHNLNQWWLVYKRVYALLSLNESKSHILCNLIFTSFISDNKVASWKHSVFQWQVGLPAGWLLFFVLCLCTPSDNTPCDLIVQRKASCSMKVPGAQSI